MSERKFYFDAIFVTEVPDPRERGRSFSRYDFI